MKYITLSSICFMMAFVFVCAESWFAHSLIWFNNSHIERDWMWLPFTMLAMLIPCVLVALGIYFLLRYLASCFF